MFLIIQNMRTLYIATEVHVISHILFIYHISHKIQAILEQDCFQDGNMSDYIRYHMFNIKKYCKQNRNWINLTVLK